MSQDRDLDELDDALGGTGTDEHYFEKSYNFDLSRATRARLWIEHLGLSLTSLAQKEIEWKTPFLFCPVFFGIGIHTYFALPQEPMAGAFELLALALLLFAFLFLRQKIWASNLVIALAVLASGTAYMRIFTASYEPQGNFTSGTYRVTADVISAEPTRSNGWRLLLQVAEIEGLRAQETPKIVRVVGRAKQRRAMRNERISFLAKLAPLQGPAHPGGYDFARAAFFDQREASGFMMGRWKHQEFRQPETRIDWALTKLVAVRATLSDRLRRALADEYGNIAAALIVGERQSISEEVNENLRQTGLAHILAISGFHMSLVAGGIFFLIRALLTLIPGFAVQNSTKNWAAAAAILTATFYLMISGAGLATQRAFVMTTVAAIAVFAMRPALSLRAVASAAMIILLYQPYAAIGPGFLMSFFAVVGIISVSEAYQRRKMTQTRKDQTYNWFLKIRTWITALFITSLIAGLATMPVAIDHFYRIAPFGLLANLLVMPIFIFLVMPSLMATVIAIPFGLETFIAPLFAWSLDHILFISASVAGWSQDNGLTGQYPTHIFGLVMIAILIAALLRTKLRWAAIPVFLFAGVSFAVSTPHKPLIYISETGNQIAVRGKDSRLVFASNRGSSFERGLWLNADGDPRSRRSRALFKGAECDDDKCTLTARTFLTDDDHQTDEILVTLIKNPVAITGACQKADLIVSPFVISRQCGHAKIIDPTYLARYGATTLQIVPTENVKNSDARAALNQTNQTSTNRSKNFQWVARTARNEQARPWQKYTHWRPNPSSN